MEVILRQDVDDLGLEGDVVDVAKGYARNYLIPRQIGVEATPQNLKAFELLKKKIEVKRLRAREEAEALRDKMQSLEVGICQKAGEEGKLYGSVTSMDIAARLEEQGFVIDRKKISLDKPIKTVGEFSVPVKIYPGVSGTLKVVISPDGEQE